MNMRVCLLGVLALGLFCWVGTAQAGVIFSDDFEGHTNYATSWVEYSDKDPGAPPVGASWVSRESNQEYQIQVWHDPVAGGNLQTPYGDQFLHMWRGSESYTEARGFLTSAAQTELAAEGKMRVEVDVYVMNGDGWGGNLGFNGFDEASTSGYGGRAFSVSFGGDGVVRLYDGHTFQDAALDAAFDTNTWEHVIIDSDFATDTWSITIDNATVSNIAFAGGDLSKIQQLLLAATDRAGQPGRGGFDNLVATAGIVPEPSSLVLLGCSLIGLLAYAWRRRK